jgi:hypothetical protein
MTTTRSTCELEVSLFQRSACCIIARFQHCHVTAAPVAEVVAERILCALAQDPGQLASRNGQVSQGGCCWQPNEDIRAWLLRRLQGNPGGEQSSLYLCTDGLCEQMAEEVSSLD